MTLKEKQASRATRFQLFDPAADALTPAATWEELITKDECHGILPTSEDVSQPLWWLDVRDAKKADVASLAQELAIHPLTAEDIVVREPREKVEVFKNYYLISLQTLLDHIPQPQEGTIQSSAPFFILVFQHAVVTFSPSGCQHVEQVHRRIRKMHDSSILSSDWICYALIDDIIDSFEPSTQAAQAETDAIEDQVFIARLDDLRDLIPRINALRKTIAHVTRCLNGKMDVLNALVKRCSAAPKRHALFPGGDYLLYLGDVQDHLITTLSSLEHLDGIIGRSQANCLAQLSVTNLRMSLTISSVMSKVTLFATIMVPCHLLTGLMGMNVVVPGQEDSGLAWFFGIVGLIVGFMVVCVAVAARYKLWNG